jgi:hypothetical protein
LHDSRLLELCKNLADVGASGVAAADTGLNRSILVPSGRSSSTWLLMRFQCPSVLSPTYLSMRALGAWMFSIALDASVLWINATWRNVSRP